MSVPPPLLLRCDAGAGIGIGHVMRSLALAQAWREKGGRASFVAAALPAALEDRLGAENFRVARLDTEIGEPADAEALTRRADDEGAVVVLDGYHFDPGYQRVVANGARSLLLLTDGGRPVAAHFDLTLDPTPEEPRPDDATTESGDHRFLRGSRYVLMRGEIRRRAASPASPRRPPHRLLLTLGGGEQGGVAGRLLKALAGLPEPPPAVRMVVGPAAMGLAPPPGLPFDVETVIDPPDMAECLADADLAVTAAGSTCWELACLGIPMVALPVAENQRPVAEALERGRLALVAQGPRPETEVVEAVARLAADPELAADLRRRGMLAVDGFGAGRVAAALWRAAGGATGVPPLRLRPATATDRRLLWSWANDPEVRRRSFDPTPIPWDSHRSWLARRLEDPDTLLFVAEDAEGEPVGQTRLDRDGNRAEIGVSLTIEARGRGFGSRLIRLAVDRAAAAGVEAVDAYVKPGNRASARAFQRAGFALVDKITRQGVACEHWVFTP